MKNQWLSKLRRNFGKFSDRMNDDDFAGKFNGKQIILRNKFSFNVL